MTSAKMTIAELRRELDQPLDQFATTVGLKSKGQASEIERENRCSLSVALTIERLSNFRIDAADLNDDVRMARSSQADQLQDAARA